MDIFVGSLSFKLKESELREAFEKYGEVVSAKIIIDKITRQSKGFGFVEMPDEEAARMAINSLNGAEMYGRPLVVNQSQKRDASERRDSPAPRPQSGSFTPRPQNTNPGPDRYGPAADGNAGSSNSENSGSGSESRGRDEGRSKSDFGRGDSGRHDFGGRGEKGFGGRSKQDYDRNRGEHKKGGGGSKKFDPRYRDEDDDW